MGLVRHVAPEVPPAFRPIVMTSLAFGFGVLPLALANGAAPAPRTRSAPRCSAAWSPPPSSP